MPQVESTLLAGNFAQNYYLDKKVAKTMTETSHSRKNVRTDVTLIPYRSLRVAFGLKKNPRFEGDILPNLRNFFERLIQMCFLAPTSFIKCSSVS